MRQLYNYGEDLVRSDVSGEDDNVLCGRALDNIKRVLLKWNTSCEIKHNQTQSWNRNVSVPGKDIQGISLHLCEYVDNDVSQKCSLSAVTTMISAYWGWLLGCSGWLLWYNNVDLSHFFHLGYISIFMYQEVLHKFFF